MMRKKLPIILPVLLVTLIIVGFATATAMGMSGAIWTTDDQGNAINQNVWYANKTDVYLNGGPERGSQLPDGDYFIKVTYPGDPSDTPLGHVSKAYQISGGRFVYDRNNPDPTMTPDNDHPGFGFVQLWAATKFSDTKNNGGEYKAWLSPDPNFVNNVSKTDNFKVKYSQIPTLTIEKFTDVNKNAQQDSNEGFIPWNVTIKNTSTGVEWTQELDGSGTTLGDGTWKGYLDPGTYVITEEQVEGWVPTVAKVIDPSKNTTSTLQATTVTVTISKGNTTVIFGNHQLAHLTVKKFNDLNGNGVWDVTTEPSIDWTGTLTGTPSYDTPINKTIYMTYTEWVEPGTYTVVEDQRLPEWVPTTATSQTVTLQPGYNTEVDFGNRQLAMLHIVKFYDYNVDGIQESNDPNITWKVRLTGTDLFGTAIDRVIDVVDGNWQNYVDPGKYTVTECMPIDQGWFATRPISVDVPYLNGGDTGGAIFGNAYLGIGGHTHGFWGNPNGEAIFTADPKYLAAINRLPLVDGDGNYVTPFSSYDTGINPFTIWDHDANGQNAAYMLSCQLATMVLNATAGSDNGFIDRNEYVLVDKNVPVLVNGENVNSDGVVTVDNLITAAMQTLQAHPLTITSGPDRDYQNALEGIIDAANQDNARVYEPLTPPIPIFN